MNTKKAHQGLSNSWNDDKVSGARAEAVDTKKDCCINCTAGGTDAYSWCGNRNCFCHSDVKTHCCAWCVGIEAGIPYCAYEKDGLSPCICHKDSTKNEEKLSQYIDTIMKPLVPQDKNVFQEAKEDLDVLFRGKESSEVRGSSADPENPFISQALSEFREIWKRTIAPNREDLEQWLTSKLEESIHHGMGKSFALWSHSQKWRQDGAKEEHARILKLIENMRKSGNKLFDIGSENASPRDYRRQAHNDALDSLITEITKEQ